MSEFKNNFEFRSSQLVRQQSAKNRAEESEHQDQQNRRRSNRVKCKLLTLGRISHKKPNQQAIQKSEREIKQQEQFMFAKNNAQDSLRAVEVEKENIKHTNNQAMTEINDLCYKEAIVRKTRLASEQNIQKMEEMLIAKQSMMKKSLLIQQNYINLLTAKRKQLLDLKRLNHNVEENIQISSQQIPKIQRMKQQIQTNQQSRNLENEKLKAQYQVVQEKHNYFTHSLSLLNPQKQKLGIEIGILNGQIGKKLRCALTNCYSIDKLYQNLNISEWKIKKTKAIQYSEIRIYLLSKLYPGMKEINERFNIKSSIYKALFTHNSLSTFNQYEIEEFKKYLFLDSNERIPQKVSKSKVFFAIGSTQRDLYRYYLNQIKKDLEGFVGCFLNISSVETNMVCESPLRVQNMVVHFSFADKLYQRTFIMINLEDKFNHSIVQPMTTRFKRKSQVGTFIYDLLGEEKRGYILLEIDKIVVNEKVSDYLKLYETVRLNR